MKERTRQGEGEGKRLVAAGDGRGEARVSGGERGGFKGEERREAWWWWRVTSAKREKGARLLREREEDDNVRGGDELGLLLGLQGQGGLRETEKKKRGREEGDGPEGEMG